MDRYSRKDAQKAFERLASALGKTWSDEQGQLWSRNLEGDLTATVGAWTLDYNGVYGGFVVEEMVNEGGGVSRPMGDMRRNAREFCDAVRFAIDALRVREQSLPQALRA